MEKMTYNQYTKHYIVEALGILLESRDFADITVKEIVEKAGVGRATFYRNFQDKESVLIYKFHELGKTFEKRIERSKEPVTKEEFYYYVAKMLCVLQENKNLMRNIFKSKVDYLYFNFLNTSLKFLFEMKRNTKNDFVHLGYSGALYNITREWIIGDCKGELVDVVDAIFMVFTGGAEIENIELKHAIVTEVLKEFKNSLKKQ